MKKITLFLIFALVGTILNAQVSYQLSSSTFQGVYYSSIAFADVDGDNDQDVLITGYSSGGISKLYTNNGSGSFTEVTGTPFTGVYHSSIAFADVDNDGDQDVLITGFTGSVKISKLYTNDGSGVFTEVTGTPFDGVNGSSIAFTDVDGDNDQDVLITGYGSSGRISKLYTNDGSGVFTEVTGTPFAGVYNSSIAFADVDNDGDQDVLITGKGNSGEISKLYTNDGSGSFTEVTGTPFAGVAEGSIAFADIDNDGDQDVMITGIDNLYQYHSKLYTNDGSGSFTQVTGTPFPIINSSSIAFADVDGDNDQDVLITGENGSGNPLSKLYTNDGSGVFTEVTGIPFEAVRHSSIAFADVDGDNGQDVLITGYNSSFQPTSKLFYTLCQNTGTESYIGCQGDGYSVTINGTIYNEANPTGTDTLTNVAGCDSVITINLVFNAPSTGTENYTGCQGDGYSVTVNGTTYNEANPTGTETLTNAVGCDSVITINLVFNAPSTGDTTVTACDSYTWYGNTYTTSGTQTHTLTNVAGCDSVVTLNLTITNSSTGTENYTGCEGDGYSVTINGTTYNEANPTGTETLTNAVGCDSVVTINLVFNAVDVATSVSGETITANLAGANYQWINCSDNSAIAGETAQSFTATANGNYAVIITDGSCSDTSACVSINSTSIEENDIAFSIFPNPTTGIVKIETEEEINSIEVYSLTGQKVATFTTKEFSIENLEKGIYFLEIINSNKKSVTRIYKL